jgi:catechol 2,3-dioxygenase-like lactoylglutathione lyase family enzyme
MLMKIWKVALLVEDMEAAEALYAGVLGMEVIERLSLGEAGEALFLDAGAVQLELIPKAAFEGEERLGVPGVHHLSFKADDVERATEELGAKGINFIKEPFEALPGMTLAFFDGLNGVNLQLFNWER